MNAFMEENENKALVRAVDPWAVEAPPLLHDPDREPTIATWIEQYKLVRFPTYAKNTQTAFARELQRFALWIGTQKLTSKLLHDFMEYRKTQTTNPASLHLTRACLLGFLGWCTDMEYIDEGILRRGPKSIIRFNKEPRRFTPEQFERLKEVTKGTLWHYASIASYRTGMRLSDCALLKWESVSLEKLFVHYYPFKTRKYHRGALCPIDAGGDFHQVLLELDKARHPDPTWAPYVCPEMAMRYPKDDGGAIAGFQEFTHFCRDIGCRHLSFHKLRNSFMSRIVDAGLSWPQACQITGLSGFSTLMRYAKPNPEALRREMEKVSQIDAQHAADTAGKMLKNAPAPASLPEPPKP